MRFLSILAKFSVTESYLRSAGLNSLRLFGRIKAEIDLHGCE